MAKNTLRSFSSGELDPALHHRADLARYATGLVICRNFIIRAQGGVHNRPGMRFVGEVKDSTKQTRLIPFEFNTEQTYILEFGDQIMRVIRDGAYVLDGVGPALFELVTPYLESEVFDINFTQSADVMTLAHRNHAVRDLGRIADDNWTLDVINFASTVTVPTGLVTVAVGTGAGTNNKTYRYVVTATDDDGVESLISAESSITTPSLDVTAGVKITWTAVAGAAFYTIYKDPSNGTGIYGFIGESVNELFEDYNIAPDTARTPPEENTPISTAGNYPGVVGYYQQRKLFANTDNLPQTFFTSQTGIFNSLRSSTPVRDDDAITFTISSRQVNEIRHIVAVEDLVLLTSGAPYRISEGQDFVLTPSTIGARPQGETGASRIRPAIVNDSVIFVQGKSNKLRDLNFGIESGRYAGNDLSIMANHLFEDRTVVDMAYADEPYGVIWCVMSDGALLGLTYQKEHQVWAWHRHDTKGFYESVAVVAEGDRDAAYFVVKRTIDGSDVRYVERLEPRFISSPEVPFFVDSGLSYDGVATTAISGLDHLEGETVAVLSDGNVVNDLVVSGGAITLPRAASIVHVGLGYDCDIFTLAIDTAQISTQMRKLNVSEVAINVQNSRGGFVGPDFDNLIEIKPRFDSDGYDPITLKTFEERVNIQPDWNDNGQVAIRQIDPLPLSILTITPEFNTGG
jgi:hypothetical protein